MGYAELESTKYCVWGCTFIANASNVWKDILKSCPFTYKSLMLSMCCMYPCLTFFYPAQNWCVLSLDHFKWVPPSKNHTMVELHQCLRSPCATDRLHSVHVCERERKSIPFCFVTLSSCVTEYSAGRGLMVKEFNGMLTLFHTTREAVSYIKRTLIAL